MSNQQPDFRYITFTLAGALRMKLLKFIKYSILGGLVWSSLLVFLGYFFGYAATQISQYIKYAGIAIFVAAIIAVVADQPHQKTRIGGDFEKRNTKLILPPNFVSMHQTLKNQLFYCQNCEKSSLF